MDPNRDLAPCLIGSGTLAHPRDMLRALETIENLEYSLHRARRHRQSRAAPRS